MSLCDLCTRSVSQTFPFCTHVFCADCLSDHYDRSSLQSKGVVCALCSLDPVLVVVSYERDFLSAEVKTHFQKILPKLRYFTVLLDDWGNLKECDDSKRGQEYAKYGPAVFLIPSSLWDRKLESKIG